MMPSTERRNALPDPWIDRLFSRLATLYGKHWLDMWAGIPMAEVKATWAENLSVLDRNQIQFALEHCARNNPFPPTCPEFVAIGKQARREERLRILPPRTPMPEGVSKKLRAFVKAKRAA